MARKSKVIDKKEDIDFITSLTQKDITTSTIMEMFGDFNGKIRFNQYDIITIPAGAYTNKDKTKSNKKPFTTTVGIYIFNIFFVQEELFDIFHYVNEEITGGKLSSMIAVITDYCLEDKLNIMVLDRFLQKTQKWMPLVTPLMHGSTEKIYGLSDYLTPKKKELAKKYKEELEAGNAVIAEKMEKELIDYALDYLGDDPCMDIYKSEARSSIGNHMKNMYIMKGPIKNPDPNATQKFYVSLSNYNDGIDKEEYPVICKSLSTGPYSRAKKTSLGGYWEKLLVSAYQDIVIGDPKTDCKTTDYLTVTITKKNSQNWKYSYVVEKNGLVELTSETLPKYIGKTVQLRYAAYCQSKDCICNKCAGNMFNRLGVSNVGVAMGAIASNIKNFAMKAFHDGTVATTEIDLKKAFGE